jgi:SAM-dependent methyltransferase
MRRIQVRRPGGSPGAHAVATAAGLPLHDTPAPAQALSGLHISLYHEFLGSQGHGGLHHQAAGGMSPRDEARIQTLVAEAACVRENCTVLDVGCGVGAPACHIARVTGARVRGITPNLAQLEVARATAERQGLGGRVRFDHGEASALPYPDETFDAVLFFESLCHFPERPRSLAEACRVLRPGGRLVGEDWLLADHAPPELRIHWAERICKAWAIPALGTLSVYTEEMTDAGFGVELARDLREDRALLHGFVMDPAARADIRAELRQTGDPIRRLVMEGVLVLGDAAASGAFTVGRFVAVKQARR